MDEIKNENYSNSDQCDLGFKVIECIGDRKLTNKESVDIGICYQNFKEKVEANIEGNQILEDVLKENVLKELNYMFDYRGEINESYYKLLNKKNKVFLSKEYKDFLDQLKIIKKESDKKVKERIAKNKEQQLLSESLFSYQSEHSYRLFLDLLDGTKDGKYKSENINEILFDVEMKNNGSYRFKDQKNKENAIQNIKTIVALSKKEYAEGSIQEIDLLKAIFSYHEDWNLDGENSMVSNQILYDLITTDVGIEDVFYDDMTVRKNGKINGKLGYYFNYGHETKIYSKMFFAGKLVFGLSTKKQKEEISSFVTPEALNTILLYYNEFFDIDRCIMNLDFTYEIRRSVDVISNLVCSKKSKLTLIQKQKLVRNVIIYADVKQDKTNAIYKLVENIQDEDFYKNSPELQNLYQCELVRLSENRNDGEMQKNTNIRFTPLKECEKLPNNTEIMVHPFWSICGEYGGVDNFESFKNYVLDLFNSEKNLDKMQAIDLLEEYLNLKKIKENNENLVLVIPRCDVAINEMFRAKNIVNLMNSILGEGDLSKIYYIESQDEGMGYLFPEDIDLLKKYTDLNFYISGESVQRCVNGAISDLKTLDIEPDIDNGLSIDRRELYDIKNKAFYNKDQNYLSDKINCNLHEIEDKNFDTFEELLDFYNDFLLKEGEGFLHFYHKLTNDILIDKFK